MTAERNNKLALIALLATLFAACVVSLGAWTRLVDAGLGCPDWPGCYGFLSVPNEDHEIALAEARFPGHEVEVEKGWPEMIHRYFAGTLGLVILAMTVWAWNTQQRESGAFVPRGHISGLLVLVVCQALFGMWTVTLKLWPQVVSIHLLGGFATLSLLFLLYLRFRFQDQIFESKRLPLKVFKRGAAALLMLVVAQIFLGAWTAANYAALACGSEFPACQGQLVPDMDFVHGFNFIQSIGPNYLGGLLNDEGRVAIQFSHRLGAIILSVCMLTYLALLLKHASAPGLRNAAFLNLGMLLLQVFLGIWNVLELIPLPIAIAHNGVGALLLLSVIYLNFQLSRIKQEQTMRYSDENVSIGFAGPAQSH